MNRRCDLVKTLEEFIQYFGEERQCSVSRELTKMFEENKRGTLKEVSDHFKQKTVKGEIVIIVAGKRIIFTILCIIFFFLHVFTKIYQPINFVLT